MCVYIISIFIGEGVVFSFSDPTLLLSSCPPLQMHAVGSGVWLAPPPNSDKLPVPSNLLLYWHKDKDHLQVWRTAVIVNDIVAMVIAICMEHGRAVQQRYGHHLL